MNVNIHRRYTSWATLVAKTRVDPFLRARWRCSINCLKWPEDVSSLIKLLLIVRKIELPRNGRDSERCCICPFGLQSSLICLQKFSVATLLRYTVNAFTFSIYIKPRVSNLNIETRKGKSLTYQKASPMVVFRCWGILFKLIHSFAYSFEKLTATSNMKSLWFISLPVVLCTQEL